MVDKNLEEQRCVFARELTMNNCELSLPNYEFTISEWTTYLATIYASNLPLVKSTRFLRMALMA